MSFPYIVQGNNVTVVIGNKPHTISKTHITYQKVVDAIKANDWETVQNIIEPKKVVLDYGQGRVSIKGETLYWDGEEFNGTLATRMVQMLQEGFTIEPLVKFMENLLENPSNRSVTELYTFLEKNSLPITPDGHFLAYKRVRDDYKDIHSGTMDNSPGKIVEMPRYKVDDNQNNTCSHGLHFCSEGYLQHFGGARTVIVKINPRDVVSIPNDYNQTKGRACRYEVIGEVGANPTDKEEFTQPVQANANNNTYKPEPKKGSNAFYKGYSDGYYGRNYNEPVTYKDRMDYDQGYDKGVNDAQMGTERYRYIEPQQVQPSAAWPFPNVAK